VVQYYPKYNLLFSFASYTLLFIFPYSRKKQKTNCTKGNIDRLEGCSVFAKFY